MPRLLFGAGILVLAVLATTAKHSTRTIQPTLMAVPRRFVVVLSKLGVLAVLGTATGALAVAASLAAGRASCPATGSRRRAAFRHCRSPTTSLGGPPSGPSSTSG